MSPEKKSPPLRVSMVEDNRYFRSGWEALLKSIPGMALVGSYPACEEAFSDPAFRGTDICLMDIGLPGMSGIEGVIHIRKHFPEMAVIMCTVRDDDESIFDSLCAGAIGYLLKKTAPEEIVAALEDAARGGSPMSPSIARRVIDSFQTQQGRDLLEADRLTPRELEILQKMALGESYAGIAAELFLSVEGVRYHIRHIYEKLQVHSRAEAIAQGLRDRIIRPPR